MGRSRKSTRHRQRSKPGAPASRAPRPKRANDRLVISLSHLVADLASAVSGAAAAITSAAEAITAAASNITAASTRRRPQVDHAGVPEVPPGGGGDHRRCDGVSLWLAAESWGPLEAPAANGATIVIPVYDHDRGEPFEHLVARFNRWRRSNAVEAMSSKMIGARLGEEGFSTHRPKGVAGGPRLHLYRRPPAGIADPQTSLLEQPGIAAALAGSPS